MKFACVVLAVFFSLPVPTEDAVSTWIYQAVCRGLGLVVVPALFAISGYLLAVRIDEEVIYVRGKGRRMNWKPWWKEEVVKRVKSLVVPFYVWSFVAFGVRLAMGEGVTDWPMAVCRLSGLNFFELPYCEPLWFLRALFVFTLLSPIFHFFTRHLRFGWTLATYVIFIAWMMCRGTLPENVNALLTTGFPLEGLVAFSLGMYLRREHLHYSSVPVAFISLALGAVFWCAMNLPGFPRIANLAKVAKFLLVPALAYGLWGLVPAKRLPRVLKSATFPVFVLGGFIAPVIPVLHGWSVEVWPQYLGLWLLPAVAGVAVAAVLSRFPRVAPWLFPGWR